MKKFIAPIALLLVIAGCGSTSTSAVTATPSATGSAVSQSTPSALPVYPTLWPRSANLAYDSTHHNVVLFGGIHSHSDTPNDTWIWQGHRWTQQQPAANPVGRQGAVLVDDPEMHAVVLFGGVTFTGTFLNDTWAWTGLNWVQLFPAHAPSVRYGAAAAFDPVRHVVLLFGGTSCICAGGMDDTWEWNGLDWSQAHPSSSPSGRGFARLAVNVAHGEAVLFGGFEGLQDTWTWDGVTWTQAHPNNTPPAIGEANPMAAQLVYDSVRKVVLFAGPNQSTRKTDTLTWSGDDWTVVTAATAPEERDGAGLAFDVVEGITVFAGGYSFGGEVSTTWGWDGATWSMLG